MRTCVLGLQLVVGQQHQAPGFQQAFLGVQAQRGALEAGQLASPQGGTSVQTELAHVQRPGQHAQARRAVRHRLQLGGVSHLKRVTGCLRCRGSDVITTTPFDSYL